MKRRTFPGRRAYRRIEARCRAEATPPRPWTQREIDEYEAMVRRRTKRRKPGHADRATKHPGPCED